MKLYNHQKEGIRFMQKKRANCLIADEMGLGKTAQILYFIKRVKFKKVLIVCPASIKFNWKNEIKLWLNEECHIISSNKSFKASVRVFVINYDILYQNRIKLAKMNFKILVLDECHFIKNPKAKRTKAVQYLRKYIKYMVGLTGTPIYDKPIDLFCFLNLLNPTEFKNYYSFAYKFCHVWRGRFGFQIKGPKKKTLPLLKEKLKELMIRRLKKNVLDLPNKIRTVIPIQIDQPKLFTGPHDSLIKIEPCISWLENALEQEEKIVVYGVHHNIIERLEEKFSKICAVIYGKTPINKRESIVNSFNKKGGKQLFIGNIKACGVGLNLTSCSTMAFIEFPWTATDLFQAEDRCHRIGQNKIVNIYYLVARETYEETIMDLIKTKLDYSNSILEDEDYNAITKLMKGFNYDGRGNN